MGRVVDFPEGRRMDHHAIRPTEPAHIIILPVVRIESVHRDQVAAARRRRHRKQLYGQAGFPLGVND